MSFRREPRTIDERVAELEAQLRQAQSTIAVDDLGAVGFNPSIVQEAGDILVGVGQGEVGILRPDSAGDVLTLGGAGTPQWAPLDAASTADLEDLQLLVWMGGL